jgi:hypothetical protein
MSPPWLFFSAFLTAISRDGWLRNWRKISFSFFLLLSLSSRSFESDENNDGGWKEGRNASIGVERIGEKRLCEWTCYTPETKVSCLLTSFQHYSMYISWYFLPSYSRLVFSYPNIHNSFLGSLFRARYYPFFFSLSKTVKREFIETFFFWFCTEDLEAQKLFYNYGWR